MAGVRDEGRNRACLEAEKLAYIPGALLTGRLVWVDRSGTRTPLDLPSRSYAAPALSPDGRFVALTVIEGASRNIWLGETVGGPLTQLTFGGSDSGSMFTADGKRVMYTHGRAGNIFSIATDGDHSTRLTTSPRAQRVTSASRNRRTLLLNEISEETGLDILRMDVGRPGSGTPFRRTPAKELGARFSPDDRWVAYASDDTGDFEIFVEEFPGPGIRRQVSTDGGLSPYWNPLGGELLYQGLEGVMSVPVAEGRPIGRPVRVWAHRRNPGALAADWALSPDGRQLLLIERAEPLLPYQINVVLNLFEALKW